MALSKEFLANSYRSDRDVFAVSNLLAPSRSVYQDLWYAVGTPDRYTISHIGEPLANILPVKGMDWMEDEDFVHLVRTQTPKLRLLVEGSMTKGRSRQIYEDARDIKGTDFHERFQFEILGLVEVRHRLTFHHSLLRLTTRWNSLPRIRNSVRLTRRTFISTTLPLVKVGTKYQTKEVMVVRNIKGNILQTIAEGLFMERDPIMIEAFQKMQGN